MKTGDVAGQRRKPTVERGVEIVAVDTKAPAMDHLEALVAVNNAAGALDSPWTYPSTVASMEGAVRYGWDLEPGRYHLLYLDGRPVGSNSIHTSEYDNLDLAWVEVAVVPGARRSGLGSLLWEHAVATANALGRTKLGTDGWDGGPAEAFAHAQGLTRKAQSINRRQHLSEVALEDVRRLHADAAAHADAYEVLRFDGPVPEDLVNDVAVMTAAINDAPLDDLDIEDEKFPPERIRAYERARELRGERFYRVVARHKETGELAGHSVVVLERDRPEFGHQHDTSVVRAHRGHRLGMLLKSEMNLLLAEREPQLVSVDTWNAESNAHMIAVNEALGYRWMGRGLEFQ